MSYHVPVLFEETVSALAVKPDGFYVDGTLGGGGHTRGILRAAPGCRVLGIDRDLDAIEYSRTYAGEFSGRFTAIHGDFCDMGSILEENGFPAPDGILLDLGVSSHQLDEGDRGFSYNADAPLDMRQNREQGISARDVVNGADRDRLIYILKEYGEERFAARIADGIIRARAAKPIETTGELVEIIDKAIPAKARQGGKHPARRTFQAIRIEVNNEIDPLRMALESMIDLLPIGGRLAVISFHSLEHRIARDVMRTAVDPCICPPGIPVCVCGRRPKAKWVVKKAVPGEAESEENHRARSSQLRVIEKIKEQ